MIDDTFAPVRRAGLFFGAMVLVVAALSVGPSLQPGPEGSSQAVATAKLRGGQPAEIAVAAVDARQRGYSQVKRNIPGSQQAQVSADRAGTIR